ncbi:MAG: DUF4255 domain-containing protein, partial [Gemmataceae bacterium]|nr:DUF4255 domain-containing protein [Gemmataceae bacterium]
MLHELDAALERLLLAAKADGAGLLDIAHVSFATPDDAFSPDANIINLFLLDVVENRELRNLQPVRERVGDHFALRAPPLRVDCTYLVTAWSNASGDQRSRTEHQLLGEALLWLGSTQDIPERFLDGQLKSAMYPPGLSISQSREDRQGGHFWSALRISPRASFFLTATIAMDAQRILREAGVTSVIGVRATVPPAGDDSTPPKTDGATYLVGGRVRGVTAENPSGEDDGAQPVAGAHVQVAPDGPACTTDANGQYILGPLPEGSHRLLVSAAGYRDGERVIQVPITDPAA